MASYDEVIPPGQAGTIRATLKTDHYRGRVAKNVAVTTNDPAAPSLNLTLRAEIIGSVVLLPNAFVALSSPSNARRDGRLLVRKDDTETGTLAVTEATATKPWIRVSTRKIAAGEAPIDGVPETRPGDWFFELEVEGPLAPGSYNEQLTFRTGLAREPVVSVPVNVFVRAAVHVNPTEVALPRPGDAGTAPEAIALVGVRPDVDPGSLKVAADTPTLEASLEPSGSRTFRLHVRWKADAGPTPDVARVTINGGGESATLLVRAVPAPQPVPTPQP